MTAKELEEEAAKAIRAAMTLDHDHEHNWQKAIAHSLLALSMRAADVAEHLGRIDTSVGLIEGRG